MCVCVGGGGCLICLISVVKLLIGLEAFGPPLNISHLESVIMGFIVEL